MSTVSFPYHFFNHFSGSYHWYHRITSEIIFFAKLSGILSKNLSSTAKYCTNMRFLLIQWTWTTRASIFQISSPLARAQNSLAVVFYIRILSTRIYSSLVSNTKVCTQISPGHRILAFRVSPKRRPWDTIIATFSWNVRHLMWKYN